MKTANEITANAIYKILGQNCWAVPSDSTDAMYKVCFSESASNWECTCRHGEVMSQYGHAAHCKHVAAVQVSIKANLPRAAQLAANEKLVDDPFIVHGNGRAIAVETSDERLNMPLNGQRGFSLLK
jgi:hypothetical protein